VIGVQALAQALSISVVTRLIRENAVRTAGAPSPPAARHADLA
jgi:hypothetical protein